MQSKIMKGGIILAMGVFLWGCATTAGCSHSRSGRSTRLQSQVNTLPKGNQQEKETHNRDLSRELAALRSEWKNDLTTEIKKIQADLLFRSIETESEIRILTTGLDEYKDFAKRPSKDVERVREDVILRTRILEERGKILEEKNRAQEDRAKALEEKIRGMEERLRGWRERSMPVASKQIEAEKVMVTLKEKARQGRRSSRR